MPRRVAKGAAIACASVLVAGFVTTRVLVARAERAFPPLGEPVAVDGLAQQVHSMGEGEPIVFVHGAFGGPQDFVATVLPELSNRYRCVLWDRPGHGYSERPPGVADPGVQAGILTGLVRELELDRPLLVGFSYGGAVVLAAGLEAPGLFRGIVLLNGPSHPWPDPIDFQYRFPTIPVIGTLAVETVLMPLGELFAAASVERAFAPQPVDAAFARSPVSLALRPESFRANAEDIRTLKPFLRAQSERYEELAVPLTLVVAEGDLVVSPTIHSPALAGAAPESTMIRIPDAGHQILYTHPAIVIGAIDAAMVHP